MLRDEMKKVAEIAAGKAEQTKNDVLEILSSELRQIKVRLTKLENKATENKTTVKPAEKPKKGE